MQFDNNLMLEILQFIAMLVVGSSAIILTILYGMSIYRQRKIIKVELFSWTHNQYSSTISCIVRLTNISRSNIKIEEAFIMPPFNSSEFEIKKYAGTLKPSQTINSFPFSFSSLDRFKIELEFPIDLSGYYSDDRGEESRQWTLILNTNHLSREFMIDAPF